MISEYLVLFLPPHCSYVSLMKLWYFCSLIELKQFIDDAERGLMQPLDEGEYSNLVKIMSYLVNVRDRTSDTEFMFEPLQDIVNLLTSYDIDFSEETYRLMQVKNDPFFTICSKLEISVKFYSRNCPIAGIIPNDSAYLQKLQLPLLFRPRRILSESVLYYSILSKLYIRMYIRVNLSSSKLLILTVKHFKTSFPKVFSFVDGIVIVLTLRSIKLT